MFAEISFFVAVLYYLNNNIIIYQNHISTTFSAIDLKRLNVSHLLGLVLLLAVVIAHWSDMLLKKRLVIIWRRLR
jgi:hypothetical protein